MSFCMKLVFKSCWSLNCSVSSTARMIQLQLPNFHSSLIILLISMHSEPTISLAYYNNLFSIIFDKFQLISIHNGVLSDSSPQRSEVLNCIPTHSSIFYRSLYSLNIFGLLPFLQPLLSEFSEVMRLSLRIGPS